MKILFAPRFKELVEKCDKKYEEIALELGYKSKGTITKLTKAKDVKLSTLIKIANYFNVSPEWLAGFDEENSDTKTTTGK